MIRGIHKLWHNEAGVLLVVGMLTLALLTFIGIAATTNGNIESEISGNEKLYQQAFYAAELGLVSGEGLLEGLLNRADLREGTTPGRFPQDSLSFDPTSHQVIQSRDGMGSAITPEAIQWDDGDSMLLSAVPSGLHTVATGPRFVIEERRFQSDSLGRGITYGVSGIYYFNVTSRGTGSNVAANVLLESVYAKRY